MQRVGARKWIARIMLGWGLASGAMFFVQGETSFYVLRLLLGAAEAGFFPAILYYLSYWFPEAYRGRIFAYFLAAVPISGIVGFPISGLLLGLDGWHGIKGWQWLFLLEAAPAVILSVVTYFYLTDQPSQARWLSAEQRAWLTRQLDVEEKQRARRSRGGVWRSLADWRVAAFAGVHFCGNLAIYGLGFFLPQIIKLFGLPNLETSLLSALAYVLGAMGMIFWGRRADRTGRRRENVLFPMAVAVAGFLGAGFFSDPYLLMASICVASFGVLGYAPVYWTLPTGILTGTASAVAIAAINSVGNFAGFVGPSIVGFLRELTGSFSTGLYLSAAAMVLAFVLIVVVAKGSAAGAAPAREPIGPAAPLG
jgi:MFS transporter, ACS family, tartrate transporter